MNDKDSKKILTPRIAQSNTQESTEFENNS